MIRIDYRENRAGWKRLHGCPKCGGDWITKDKLVACSHCGHVRWVQPLYITPHINPDRKDYKANVEPETVEP